MRSLWLLLLLVVWACESDPQPQCPKQAKNLCKYSELLTITPAKNGFLIRKHEPHT
jgi:hypothetical protein